MHSCIAYQIQQSLQLIKFMFRWPVGVDMWRRSCRPEVWIRRRVREKIPRISNLLKTFEVRTLSNSNANFVTSLLVLLLLLLMALALGWPWVPVVIITLSNNDHGYCCSVLVGVQSIVINQSVCLSVCLSVSIPLKPLDRCSRNLVCRSPVAMARCSSGGVALHCVLMVLWMTLRLAVMGATPKDGIVMPTLPIS